MASIKTNEVLEAIVVRLDEQGKIFVRASQRRSLSVRADRQTALSSPSLTGSPGSVRCASAIVEDAQEKGWALIVLDNPLDLTTPGGRAIANMLAAFAELERDLISSRMKDALAARKARGLDNGRKTAIPAGLLRRISLSRDAGASFGRISRDLTTEAFLSPTGLPGWHEATIRRAYTTAKHKEQVAQWQISAK